MLPQYNQNQQKLPNVFCKRCIFCLADEILFAESSSCSRRSTLTHISEHAYASCVLHANVHFKYPNFCRRRYRRHYRPETPVVETGPGSSPTPRSICRCCCLTAAFALWPVAAAFVDLGWRGRRPTAADNESNTQSKLSFREL